MRRFLPPIFFCLILVTLFFIVKLPIKETFEFIPEASYSTKEGDELKDFVASNLSRIPTQLARAMSLHFLDERSHKEIAEMEETSVSAIKTRIYRAKRELRKLIDPQSL